VTLDRTFYGLLLVTGRICDFGRNVLQSSLVTVPIRDIGQNVLQSSFQTVSSNSPSYCYIFFLMAFFEEAFILNVI